MIDDFKDVYKDYICRNKNGDLVKFKCQYWAPRRREDIWIGNEWVNLGAYEIGEIVTDDKILNKYSVMTWEDDPIKLNK